MNKRKAFVQNDNNNAVAYYRYSSHAQNECSIAQQRKEVQENEYGDCTPFAEYMLEIMAKSYGTALKVQKNTD